MPGHGDYKVNDRRLRHDGFLKIEDVDFEFTRYDGTSSGKQTHQVCVHGDAAAVLAYDRTLDKLVLVEQFRVATVRHHSPQEGWITEIPAGRVERHENARETARRELAEETGYDLTLPPKDDPAMPARFEHIATIQASPGWTSERIHIFFVEVEEKDRQNDDGSLRPGGAKRADGEDIRPHLVSPEQLFADIDRGLYRDPKLLVAAQWFRTVGASRSRSGVAGRMPRLTTFKFSADDRKQDLEKRVLGIWTGNILDIDGIDIWVNSENTDMVMDRFFGTSISATIRYYGAEKHRNGTIYRDTIAEQLKARLGGEIFVKPAAVLVTGSGSLMATHKVRKIFHAAAVYGQLGKGLSADPKISAQCVTASLDQAADLNAYRSRWWPDRFLWSPYRSILFPLLGAGSGGRKPPEIARAMVDQAVDHMRRNPTSTLNQVYFLAYDRYQLDVLTNELKRHTGEHLEFVAAERPR